MDHTIAIRNQLRLLLKSSSRYCLFCEGINDTFYGSIADLPKNFPNQCFELPCSENASVGLAIGAASVGLLPIVSFQRVEFALLALEQLINNGAKLSFLSEGKISCPSFFRFVIGRGWGQGPSHSQSLETIFGQIPNLNVALPVFPADSELILANFHLHHSPTISLEHRWVHYTKRHSIAPTSLNPYVVRAGSDLTIIATSYGVVQALKLAEIFNSFGISIEVINQFNLGCFEYCSIFDSVLKTKKLICIDLHQRLYGCGAEIICSVAEAGIKLSAPPKRLSSPHTFSPSSFRMISEYYLSLTEIALTVCELLFIDGNKLNAILSNVKLNDSLCPPDQPNINFNGPF